MSRPTSRDTPTLTGPSFLDEVLEAVLAHPLFTRWYREQSSLD